MILPLLLAAAAPQTALDAERAFDAAAARDGQWTAFRAFAAPGAVMLIPQPVDAATFLRDRDDPPASVRWQPALSIVSCDGDTAVNTGPWQRPDGSVGYFTTVWQRQPDGSWKWLLDAGDTLEKAEQADAAPIVTHASCTRAPAASFPEGATGGRSGDNSLRWWYTVRDDGSSTLAADYWDGGAFHPALADQLQPR